MPIENNGIDSYPDLTSQGVYEAKNYSEICSNNSVEAAVLSNYNFSLCNIDEVINLNHIDLSQEQILRLFFPRPSRGFHIDICNLQNKALAFSQQFFESTHSNHIRFSLYDNFLRVYANKNNISLTHICPIKKMLFIKEISKLYSLGNITESQITLSYDQCIQQLIDSNIIKKVENQLSTAYIKLRIVSNIHSINLDTTLSVNFLYNTVINGYVNIDNNNNYDILKTYSNCIPN